MAVIERKQRWAAFSVKAHRDLLALASDLLLYDRIILPVPEDDPEFYRWLKLKWDPEGLAKTAVQAGGRIIPVPWTRTLRDEWERRVDDLGHLDREVAYGMTGVIYASYPPAWNEIVKGLQGDAALGPEPEQVPKRKPALIAGYQSRKEATAELLLAPADEQPGNRDVDRQVALHVQRLVLEPDIANPEEAFLTAVRLADDPKFQEARRHLFDLEDDLYVDGWEPAEIEQALADLQSDYDQVVRAFTTKTRQRRVASLLPFVGGWAAAALGQPHLKTPVAKSLSYVSGRFIQLPQNPGDHPGRALDMIRVAYRD